VRGSTIFIWAFVLYAAVHSTHLLIKKYPLILGRKFWGVGWVVVSGAILGGTVLLVYRAQDPVPGSWRGYVSRDKWELVEHVARHIPNGAVIATIDPEVAYLLPVYTSAKPLFSMFALTARSSENELRRYFFTSRLFGVGDKALNDLIGVAKKDLDRYRSHVMGGLFAPFGGDNSDAVLVTTLVVYYAYNSRYVDVFKVPERHKEFVASMEDIYSQTTNLTYSFEYVIVNKSSVATMPSSWPAVYENSSYRLLKRIQ
jgi:hypothetical protein